MAKGASLAMILGIQPAREPKPHGRERTNQRSYKDDMASTETKQTLDAAKKEPPGANAGPKQTGKFKEAIGLASTALPIAGALGTLGVWLAANFYVGDVQIVPDRTFNTLEVRVSDKKGQESVFHSPHFQLMPGQYHLEVTFDSQYKQHADVTASFRKHSKIALHVPGAATTPATTGDGSAEHASNQALPIASNGDKAATIAPNSVEAAEAAMGSDYFGTTSGSKENSSSRKHWWQFWKKPQSDNNAN